ncbi:hypothetical protein N8697_01745 [bacterium]|nr:hypothetical protein [bacterium]
MEQVPPAHLPQVTRNCNLITHTKIPDLTKGSVSNHRLEFDRFKRFGNNMEMVGGGISTIWGGDINLLANRINMERSAGLKAISPIGGEGGDIGIKSGELHMKWAEFGTSSVGGHGGDVVVDSNVIDLYESSVQANNYYGIDQGKHFKTGNIRITAKDSFVGYNQRVAIESNTPGGAGDLSVSAGQLIGDGTGVGSHSEFWIMAYRGYTGQLTIDADEFDARQVRVSNSALNDIYNPWFPNGMKKLSKAEKEVYGDITINARDIDLKNFILFYGNRINDQAMTLGDIVINAENDLTIGSVAIHSFHDDAIGMGGDITFQARNIINGMDPDKIDPTDYPSITRTGSLKFIAEENLELGRMKINGINISPTRELVTMFKGKEISLGMDLGDEAVSVENVVVEPESNPDRHSMVIQSEGDVHFVSGVNLSTPKLLLEASNLNINDSSIHLAGAYASEFKVRDEMNLRGGSLIESLSPTGKRSGKARDATTLNISSGQLTLDPGSSIRTINETGSPTDNKPIANLKIQSDFISLDDANIFSSTSNQSKAGDLSIEASGLSLNNGSALASFSYSQAKSGDVTIDAGQAVLAEKSFIANGLNKEILNSGQDPFAPGDAGDISINADRLRLEGGSFIRNAQIDMALSGDVSITSDEIKIAGRSFISTESIPLYQSDFSNRTEIDQNGSVSIKTKSLDLSESSYVKTTTVIPKRNAGDIIIEADAVSLSGRSSMLSNTEPNKFEAELGLTGLDYGNAGRLEIKTGSLQLADQSKISSDSFTSGDGGDVSLTATELAMANRSAIYAGALGQGEGGRITIDTAAMNLSGKSAVVADVRDSGNGGEVSVKAAALDMDESLIYGSTSGEGAGSRISVDTDSITLKNGARIESAASAGGAAGELVVQSGMVSITGMGEGFDPKDIEGGETGERVASGLLTSTEGSGDAGTIELKADQLDMQQGLIGSASTGVGAAGSVVLRLARGLSLGQGASVSVSSSQADGGDIEIESAGEVRFVRSELTASAAKDGGSIRLLGAGSTYIRDSRMSAEAGQDGGNITISKPELLFINRGQLSANAVHGYGGYIQVSANTYLPSIDSLITASSEYGAQGVVEIDTVETDIGSGLVVLPEQLEDRSVNLAERCALRLQGDVSSFFLNGQGGIPVWSKDTYLPTVIVPELDDTDRSRGQEDAQ